MTLEQMVALVLGSATVGAILKSIVDWWLARGDKRLSREDAIAAANDALAAKLRDELRIELERRDAENRGLRERQRANEQELARLVGQMVQVNQLNADLRNENMELQRQNGEANGRINELARQNANQALQLSVMENDLETAKARIGVLESALRAAQIPVPEPSRRRGDTGPLSPAVA
jgi:hypothetical protein